MKTEQKLTITHLQHYLAYGLKVQLSQKGIFNLDEEFPQSHNEICEITNLVKCNDNWEVEISSDKDYSYGLIELDEIAPLLLPLSALHEEIDGEIGIVEIAKMLSGTVLVDKIDGACRNLAYFRCTFEDGIEELIINERCEGWYRSYFDKNQPNTGRNVVDQYEVFEYLFSHQYDVYDLCSKGIAIDKRSVK